MPSDVAPSVALVVAAAENNVIGAAGSIPWRLPADLKRFKELTLGHTVVMGRHTHVSIGRPLPKRRTIVVTSGTIEGMETATSLEGALAMAQRPVFLVGGAAIYAQGMRLADTIYLTRVHAAPDGDTYFPVIDETVFRCVAREEGVRGPSDEHDFTFLTYRRIRDGD